MRVLGVLVTIQDLVDPLVFFPHSILWYFLFVLIEITLFKNVTCDTSVNNDVIR